MSLAMFETKANDKRTQIMQAAMKTFVQKGFHGATVEEIAVAAGVGKGTVYEYFASKDDLFQSIFREGKQYFIEMFRSQIGSEQDLRNKLKRILQIWAEFVAVHRDVAMLFISTQVKLNGCDAMEQHRDEILAIVEDIFRQGMSQGIFRSGNAKIFSHLFWGACFTICGYIVLYQVENVEPLINEAVNAIFHGYLA